MALPQAPYLVLGVLLLREGRRKGKGGGKGRGTLWICSPIKIS